MKIAQVCPRYHPYIGGIETHEKEINERLVSKGLEAEILTTDPSGKLLKEESINDVNVRRFKSWAPSEAYYFSTELKKYLMENSASYDIVHAHNYQAFPALYAAQAKKKNKFVFTPHYHGKGHTFLRNLLLMPYKFLGKSIFRKADKIICVSNYEKSLIINHFKIREEKVVVVPNGINLEEFESLKKRKKDYRTILYVGRLEKYKGIHSIIKVLPKLDNDVVFEVVGKGPYDRILIKLVSKLGVNRRVKFFQNLPRNELLQKYANADLFVLLSTHEAYGICVAEALASGTPCIVADTSALREWIDDRNCFGIENPINLSELANLASNVMERSVEDVKLPDWGEITEKLVELYEKV